MTAHTIHVLATDDLHVEVLPQQGARLHRIRVFGHDVLRGR